MPVVSPPRDHLGSRLPALDAQVKRVLPIALGRPDARVPELRCHFRYLSLLVPAKAQRGVESNSDLHVKPRFSLSGWQIIQAVTGEAS